jgi:hypothetical protein
MSKKLKVKIALASAVLIWGYILLGPTPTLVANPKNCIRGQQMDFRLYNNRARLPLSSFNDIEPNPVSVEISHHNGHYCVGGTKVALERMSNDKSWSASWICQEEPGEYCAVVWGKGTATTYFRISAK